MGLLQAASTHGSFNASALGAFSESDLKARGGGAPAGFTAVGELIHIGLRGISAAVNDEPRLVLNGLRGSQGIDTMVITYDDASQETLTESDTIETPGGGSLVVLDGDNFFVLDAYTIFEWSDNATDDKIATFVDVLAGSTVIFRSDLTFMSKGAFPFFVRQTNWIGLHPAFSAEMDGTFDRFSITLYNQNHDVSDLEDAWTDTKIFYSDATDETQARENVTASTTTVDYSDACGSVPTPYGWTRFRVDDVVSASKTVTKAQMLDTGAAVLLEVFLTACATDIYRVDDHIFPP
jgi:hypothetical protein